MNNADAFLIGFWIEHTKHSILESVLVKGEDGVIDCLEYLLKLLTKHKLVKDSRGELRDYIKLFKRKYHGRRTLNQGDGSDIVSFLYDLSRDVEKELKPKREKIIKETRVPFADVPKVSKYPQYA